MTKKIKIAIAFSLVMLLGTSLFVASENVVSKSSTSFQSIDQLVDLVTNPSFATTACCGR